MDIPGLDPPHYHHQPHIFYDRTYRVQTQAKGISLIKTFHLQDIPGLDPSSSFSYFVQSKPLFSMCGHTRSRPRLKVYRKYEAYISWTSRVQTHPALIHTLYRLNLYFLCVDMPGPDPGLRYIENMRLSYHGHPGSRPIPLLSMYCTS